MYLIGVLVLCAAAASVSAITKSEEPSREEVPWAVNIMFSNDKETHHCGGVLIHDKWVLSTASCTRKNADKINALIGAADMARVNQTIKVVKLIVHEKFGWFSWKNDIALLQLERPPRYYDIVQKIRLPTRTQGKKKTFKGEKVTVSGWGKDGSGRILPLPHIRKIDLEVISNFACWWSYPIYLDDTNMCTQGKGVPCDGDEGGPLTWWDKDAQTFRLVGMPSYEFDTFGCTSLYPAVYCRVGDFLSWIEKNTNNEVEIED